MPRIWPFAGAFLFAGAAGLSQHFQYTKLIARHAWTAATITIGVGIVFSVLAAVLGWFLGRALRDLAVPGADKKRPALIAGAILAFSVFITVSMYRNGAREDHLRAIREEELTLERARALFSAGTLEEKRSLGWNRSCPPEILRELALSPDVYTRADVAANPATPDEVAAKLVLDPNETVRVNAGWHPSRRK